MNENLSVGQLLVEAQACGMPRLDAQILLLTALERDPHDRAWLWAHDQDVVLPQTAIRWRALCERWQAGEPVAYLVGHKEFYGLDLQVDPRVLIPRPDTETLVDWTLELIRAAQAPLHVIDLGTGSGAIALALASQKVLGLQVTATDASADALAVAESNARRLALAVRFRQGHWLGAVPGERFDIIVSNPPYIAEGDQHLDALRHEPSSALGSGPDGLSDIRTIVKQAPDHLRNGGWLLFEHGHDQSAEVRSLLSHAGFSQVTSHTDLAGIERCTGGQWLERR
ncbi:MAG: release factor glutamine methyltransferase [Betaproteobacteria bacterium]|nr:release factor glutamine methyltransferase [Betaproteobacteria bacterium]